MKLPGVLVCNFCKLFEQPLHEHQDTLHMLITHLANPKTIATQNLHDLKI